jgi:hypothetical protein
MTGEPTTTPLAAVTVMSLPPVLSMLTLASGTVPVVVTTKVVMVFDCAPIVGAVQAMVTVMVAVAAVLTMGVKLTR